MIKIIVKPPIQYVYSYDYKIGWNIESDTMYTDTNQKSLIGYILSKEKLSHI